MRARRLTVNKFLNPQKDRVISIANFPGLGTVSAFKPDLLSNATNEASKSCYIPDEVINSHARFK